MKAEENSVPVLSIEEEVFQRKKWDPARMDAFGFGPADADGIRRYAEEFMNGDFRAEVSVGADGRTEGKVTDTALDEEYLPVRIRSRAGSFVGEVRLQYEGVLRKVAHACCSEEYFVFPQSNRLADEIQKRHGEQPDFPFSTARSYGVFRYAGNRKWYGLIMQLAKGRVARPVPESEAGEPAEFLNVKIPEGRMEEALSIPGFYPGYHMDSRNWASIILDGTIPDETVLEWLEASRELVAGSNRQALAGKRRWIVPANPAYYDVEGALSGGPGTVITWKQGRGIRVGDTAYMYLASPFSEIRCECEVTETGIPFSYADENVKIDRLMKIRLIRTFPPHAFPYALLRTCGVKLIRGPVAVPEELQKRLDAFPEKAD